MNATEMLNDYCEHNNIDKETIEDGVWEFAKTNMSEEIDGFLQAAFNNHEFDDAIKSFLEVQE